MSSVKPEATWPPSGTTPVYLRDGTLKSWGMKTGEGVADMVEWKRVFKEVIEQEIEKKGPSSDFYEYKDDLMVSRATYGATVVQGRVFQLVARLAHFIHIHII